MADEVQRLRDLVSQLEADNEQLLQERAAFRDVPGGAAAGPSGSVSHAPSASAAPVMERLVVVPRDRKCPMFSGKTGLGIAEWRGDTGMHAGSPPFSSRSGPLCF